jgi:ankyrin repeat protein
MATDDTGRIPPAVVSAFMDAVQRDDAAAVEGALNREPRLIDVTANGGWAPLHIAAQVGAQKTTRLLLAAGANREARFQGKSPLGVAIEGRKVAVAKLLVDGKARVDDVDGQGRTALHLAAVKGVNEIITYLLDRGMDINERSHNRYGVTPLQDAALEGQVESARLLLGRGANPNAVGSFGYTALDDARDNQAMVTLLKQHGARLAKDVH